VTARYLSTNPRLYVDNQTLYLKENAIPPAVRLENTDVQKPSTGSKSPGINSWEDMLFELESRDYPRF
jgi:hypothetical protein